MDTTYRFADTVRDLTDEALENARPLPAALHLASSGRCSVYFAPLEHINADARVVIVGITPGRHQALVALRTVRAALRRGESVEAAAAAAKNAASFSGPMRGNLVRMLDHFGLNHWLGVSTTMELFAPGKTLAHFTSALQFPVFIDGRNYTGRSPKMSASAFLREQLETSLPRHLGALPEAVVIPLGDAVSGALAHLQAQGLISSERVFPGLVHPSGANAERIAYLLGTKPKHTLSSRTNAEAIDAGRERARAFMARLTARR